MDVQNTFKQRKTGSFGTSLVLVDETLRAAVDLMLFLCDRHFNIQKPRVLLSQVDLEENPQSGNNNMSSLHFLSGVVPAGEKVTPVTVWAVWK